MLIFQHLAVEVTGEEASSAGTEPGTTGSRLEDGPNCVVQHFDCSRGGLLGEIVVDYTTLIIDRLDWEHFCRKET